MPAAESAHIDIRQFLETQRQQRYRAFVLHDRPLVGKTTFVRQLAASIPGGVYLDVLAHVASDPTLASGVDLFDAEALRNLALAHAAATSASLLLVDEFDFLIHMWGGDLSAFQHLVATLSVTETPTILGFVLQSRPSLEDWTLHNTLGQSRIFTLEALKPL